MQKETLKDIASQIEATGKSRQMAVRELLVAIGKERRGKHVAKILRRLLRRHRLKVDPDFENVHIDAVITLSLGPKLGRPAKTNVNDEANPDETENGAIGDEKQSGVNVSALLDSARGERVVQVGSEAPEELLANDVLDEKRPDVVMTVRQGIPSAGKPPLLVRRNENINRALTMMIEGNVPHLVVIPTTLIVW